jgi:hypothetical protein
MEATLPPQPQSVCVLSMKMSVPLCLGSRRGDAVLTSKVSSAMPSSGKSTSISVPLAVVVSGLTSVMEGSSIRREHSDSLSSQLVETTCHRRS